MPEMDRTSKSAARHTPAQNLSWGRLAREGRVTKAAVSAMVMDSGMNDQPEVLDPREVSLMLTGACRF